MSLLNWLSFFRKLARDVRGASFVFVAAAIIPLVGFVGLGTDAARGYLVKARLSQALDAAGLAGAQVANDPTLLQQDITMYFNSNFPQGFMGANITGPSFTFDSQNDKLTVTANAAVPTTFMRVLGFETMNVSATTEVTRKTQYLDVVMAIDISGSMSNSAGGGQTRIQAARAAALTMVGILYGTAETKTLLRMGLVPWSSKVKVWDNGSSFSSSLTQSHSVDPFTNPVTGATQSTIYVPNNSPVPLLSWPPANWAGCVYQRYLNDGIGTNDADVIEGSLSTPQGDWVAWQPILGEGEPAPGYWTICSSASWPYECTSCPNHGITRLNQSKTTITNAINELTSPSGATNIPQGLGWAWRVLTPAAPYTEALENPEGERVQAVVLLTDGENYGYYGDGYKGIWGIGSAAQANMDARLLALANNMKAAGIVVYVIQFANEGTALQTLLQQVATGTGAPYYHYAPDPSALTQVFTEIANHLSELRLSK